MADVMDELVSAAQERIRLLDLIRELVGALERIEYECDDDLSGMAKLFIRATITRAKEYTHE